MATETTVAATPLTTTTGQDIGIIVNPCAMIEIAVAIGTDGDKP